MIYSNTQFHNFWSGGDEKKKGMRMTHTGGIRHLYDSHMSQFKDK